MLQVKHFCISSNSMLSQIRFRPVYILSCTIISISLFNLSFFPVLYYLLVFQKMWKYNSNSDAVFQLVIQQKCFGKLYALVMFTTWWNYLLAIRSLQNSDHQTRNIRQIYDVPHVFKENHCFIKISTQKKKTIIYYFQDEYITFANSSKEICPSPFVSASFIISLISWSVISLKSGICFKAVANSSLERLGVLWICTFGWIHLRFYQKCWTLLLTVSVGLLRMTFLMGINRWDSIGRWCVWYFELGEKADSIKGVSPNYHLLKYWIWKAAKFMDRNIWWIYSISSFVFGIWNWYFAAVFISRQHFLWQVILLFDPLTNHKIDDCRKEITNHKSNQLIKNYIYLNFFTLFHLFSIFYFKKWTVHRNDYFHIRYQIITCE